ncbi:DUF3558 domain-containing protein [Nocardia sp. NPDC127579]|uniref:DUF3558 domain-containing protein n=1 Tax=Nocardia sp. NPDC127579 TaxID=3345402 RepID=UPI00362AEEF4
MAGLVAGCGPSKPAEKSAQPTTRDLAANPIFNVCSELSDATLRGVGLDPSSKDVVTDPPTGVSSWRVCAWRPTGTDASGKRTIRVTIFSSAHTLAESRANTKVNVLRDANIGPRQGLVLQDKTDTDESCYAAMPAEQGMFEVNISWGVTSVGTKPDLCELAVEWAADLEPHLPK